MGRTTVPEDDRKDFHLYVDEFHNFVTDSFAGMLAEARKYRLGLTLSHQYIDQLRDEIRDAVFGNVGSVIAFRVGNADADKLEKEFGKEYPARSFTELANHEVCVKMLVDGGYSQPFLGKTFAPMGTRYGRRPNLIRRSREKYATKRSVVEDRIKRWMER